MNKLSKIFLVIIIILTIVLGIMTYYCFYWREGYLSAANELVRIINLVGGSITTTYEDDDSITTTFGDDEPNDNVNNVEQTNQ